MKFDRETGLLELIRWQGRGLRHDYAAGRGLLEACFNGVELGLPDDFLTASLCVLESAAQRMGASAASVRADFSRLFDLQAEKKDRNLRELDNVRARLEDLKLGSDEVLLLGDPAVLLGLYGSPGAFGAQTWAVGIPGLSIGVGDSVTEQAVRGLPFEIRFGWLGRLERRLMTNSQLTTVGDAEWRVPSQNLLIVVLAARVGEPEANPANGTWAHLAAALKAMRDEVDLDEILGMAEGLDLTPRVHRGLAVVCSVFPELSRIIPGNRLEIPAWERVALRVAATRLVKTAVADEE